VRGVLLCPPDHFDVIDVKNPFMEGRAGTVDRALARAQWEALREAFRRAGAAVETVEPVPGCEDMVFCANPTLTGLDAGGRPLCLLSRMTHASRRREVPAFARWFGARGWRVEDPLPGGCRFEGGGDALWHPGRRLLWAGAGPRSDEAAHEAVGRAFGAEVVPLRLVDPRFYHLDTCLCALDAETALVFPGAFDAPSRDAIRLRFAHVLEVEEGEALGALACNAAAFPGGTVVLDRRAERTARDLGRRGFRVIEVDTGEFLKSGGSVFCMKQWLW
jgi:N-dimethylarginine dimethylaminohydrolase